MKELEKLAADLRKKSDEAKLDYSISVSLYKLLNHIDKMVEAKKLME